MAKKIRIVKSYRIHPDTVKAIKKYARKRGVNNSRALEEMVSSAILMQVV